MKLISLLLTAVLLCSAVRLHGVEIKPEDEGLDHGQGGHWGIKNDKDWVDSRWSNVDIGPIMSCALQIPGGNANKGIAIQADEYRKSGVSFDAERLGICAAWTGSFVQFSGARYGLIQAPAAKGQFISSMPQKDLWNHAQGKYKGLYLHGPHVTLSYSINNTDILESPWSETTGGMVAITRTMRINASTTEFNYLIAGADGMQPMLSDSSPSLCILSQSENALAIRLVGIEATLVSDAHGFVTLLIPPHSKSLAIKLLMWSGKTTELPSFKTNFEHSSDAVDLTEFCKPGSPRWGAGLPTQGAVSKETNSYVVDSIALPFNNPWHAMLFCSGLDFLENGDAVISTLHGDVWVVSGIDAGLQNTVWKRFATGLFQPIGVKIIRNRIYVLGRDQITILNDTNNDGEADFYENFCNLMKTSPSGHDYSAGLEADRAGNLYHVDPLGLHRISPTGDKYETIAAGWRNPVTLAIGPSDEITVAPQEGNWTPASQICEVKPGDWYGFQGPQITPARPLGYNQPLCYIPRLIDNSTGGMLWAPANSWGPLSGHLLNLSFGQCTMQMVLRETTAEGSQGGVVPLDIHFQSGSFRGRVRPQDGQVYVMGTQGWATSASKDGCFQRVRFTGANQTLPVSVNTSPEGLKLIFSSALDAASVQDVDSYSIEQWNYHYGPQYGSSEYSVAQPTKAGHDTVEVTSSRMDSTGTIVTLAIPNLHPVMQMRIKYRLKANDGSTVRGEIDYTIRSTNEKHFSK